MKVRLGFVSNSSSSSFLIYGVCIEKNLEAFGKSYDDDDDNDVYSLLEDALDKDSKISIEDPSGGCDIFVGLSWSGVKDDETGKQFKERAEKEITALLNKVGYKEPVEFRTHSEAWFDG